MSTISGKVIVVTGASRGIGLEFVKQFLARGNRVIAACRQPDVAKSNLESLGDVSVTQLDVSSTSSVQQWAATVQQLVPHVDVVINNAGIYGPRVTLDTVAAEDMINVFMTNTIGPLLVVQALRSQGLLRGGTSGQSLVANVTSKVGSIDDNGSGGGYAYRASKAALNIVTKSLSIDLQKEGVTCTLLHPGWVKTDMTSNNGLIDVETSVGGMIGVLESGVDLQGSWHDYAGKSIPW